MKLRLAVVIAIVGVVTSLAIRPAASRAGDNGGITNAAGLMAVAPVASGNADYSYVGSKKCKKCHMKVYKSWEKTKMAQAFETLKPGQAKEQKEKFNLDVNKDYSTDPTCLKCHTVGYGKPGGYAIPDPNDKKAVRKASKLEGIGCESCHGPGSEYVKVFNEILKSKRKYRSEELHAVGLNKIDANVCLSCHNEESPTINPGDTFDYEERKDKGTHEHLPLQQREG